MKVLRLIGIFVIFTTKSCWGQQEVNVCGENEVYDSCYNPCPSQLCEDIGKRPVCPEIPPNECKPACKCILNHRRDVNGDCVRITDCPPLTCPSEYEFFRYCPNPCTTDVCDVTIECEDPNFGTYECFPTCLCDKNDGFCRSQQTGLCRPINGTDLCSKRNEVWSECGNNGCQKTCDSYFEQNRNCDDTVCQSGCICAVGYFRNRLGECVKLEDCGVGVCGENERYTFCQPCPKGSVCPAICRGPSVCVCNKGYIRDEYGICYKPRKLRCNKANNEVFDICPSPEKTCEDVFSGNNPGPQSDLCEPACVCKSGYVRKENGDCVLPEKCCADPNAVVTRCPYNCGGGTCANPLINKNCRKACPEYPLGCECVKGYTRRNEDSPKCIKISRCPKNRLRN